MGCSERENFRDKPPKIPKPSKSGNGTPLDPRTPNETKPQVARNQPCAVSVFSLAARCCLAMRSCDPYPDPGDRIAIYPERQCCEGFSYRESQRFIVERFLVQIASAMQTHRSFNARNCWSNRCPLGLMRLARRVAKRLLVVATSPLGLRCGAAC